MHLSIITSFANEEVTPVFSAWPKVQPLPACEYYAFMRNDPVMSKASLLNYSLPLWLKRKGVYEQIDRLQNLVRKIPFQYDRHRKRKKIQLKSRPSIAVGIPDVNICEWLAKNVNNAAYLKSLARETAEKLAGQQCIGFATHFPEITTSRPSGSDAAQALRFICRLAREMNANHGAQVRFIEIVGGSLTDAICWAKISETPGRKEKRTFVAERMTREEAFDRLLRAIGGAVPELHERTSFAIELEPGPLFAVSDWEDLKELHRRLNEPRNREWESKVGFNCDVGHWRLAGITPSIARMDPEGPMSRVVHAHISETGRGHFCDYFDKRGDDFRFREWIDFVREAYAMPVNADRCSGHISVELEMCMETEQVEHGVTLLTRNVSNQP